MPEPGMNSRNDELRKSIRKDLDDLNAIKNSIKLIVLPLSPEVHKYLRRLNPDLQQSELLIDRDGSFHSLLGPPMITDVLYKGADPVLDQLHILPSLNNDMVRRRIADLLATYPKARILLVGTADVRIKSLADHVHPRIGDVLCSTDGILLGEAGEVLMDAGFSTAAINLMQKPEFDDIEAMLSEHNAHRGFFVNDPIEDGPNLLRTMRDNDRVSALRSDAKLNPFAGKAASRRSVPSTQTQIFCDQLGDLIEVVGVPPNDIFGLLGISRYELVSTGNQSVWYPDETPEGCALTSAAIAWTLIQHQFP